MTAGDGPGSTVPIGPADGPDGVVALADALRRHGVGIGTGQVVTCQRAVVVLGDELADRYWAGRTTLINDPADLGVFDRVFRAMAAAAFEEETLPAPPPTQPPAETTAASDRGGGASGDDGEQVIAGLIAAERERLRHRRSA